MRCFSVTDRPAPGGEHVRPSTTSCFAAGGFPRNNRPKRPHHPPGIATLTVPTVDPDVLLTELRRLLSPPPDDAVEEPFSPAIIDRHDEHRGSQSQAAAGGDRR